MKSRARFAALLLAMGALLSPGSIVPADGDEAPTLANLSLEQLSQIKITTAAKRPEALAETPAAATVLTGDEVRRSGAATLPDALRYVPGIDVAQVASYAWGVGARGFIGQFANQLLVMVDGRSIYEPSFGGTLWARRELFFEDLDRIEVIRGPGGTLWGANAVNGVINILTKDARDTQGTVLYGGGGSFHEVMGGARYGFQVSELTSARVYATYNQFGDMPARGGLENEDHWGRYETGFRVDHHPDDATHATVQGDFYQTFQNAPNPIPSLTPPYNPIYVWPVRQTGANVLGRWTRAFSDASTLMLQGYWNFDDQRDSFFLLNTHSLDFEVQHNLKLGERHTLVYGAGYRAIFDRIAPSPTIRVAGREDVANQLFSVFAQDEITLVADKVFMTLGSKFEHNDYTGWEVQPSARLRWQPTANQTIWAAISRAVSTPNHMHNTDGAFFDVRVFPPGALGAGTPATLQRIFNSNDHSEELLAYEVGYRIAPKPNLTLDVTAFYNEYDRLLALVPGRPNFTSSPPLLPVYDPNAVDGTTYGTEITAGWEPVNHWRLQASYSYFHSDVALASLGRAGGGGSPQQKATLRSSVDFGEHWEWDAGLRFVDQLPAVNIPAYIACDMRVAWKPNRNWELAVAGQNLFDRQHPEYPPGFLPRQLEVPRSVYGKVTWRF